MEMSPRQPTHTTGEGAASARDSIRTLHRNPAAVRTRMARPRLLWAAHTFNVVEDGIGACEEGFR